MNHHKSIVKHFLAASALAFALPMATFANPGFDGGMGIGPGMGMGRGPGGGMMHDGHHARHGAGMMPLLHQLDLSEAQQDKVFSIMHAQAPLMREQAKIAHKARTELRELGFADKFDDAKARSLADAEARAHAEMALLRTRTAQQIFALLTPEQRKQALDLKARHADMHHGMGMGPGADRHMGPGMGRGPGRHGGPGERWNPPGPRGDL